MNLNNERTRERNRESAREKQHTANKIQPKAKGILHLVLVRDKVDFVVVQQPKSALN